MTHPQFRRKLEAVGYGVRHLVRLHLLVRLPPERVHEEGHRHQDGDKEQRSEVGPDPENHGERSEYRHQAAERHEHLRRRDSVHACVFDALARLEQVNRRPEKRKTSAKTIRPIKKRTSIRFLRFLGRSLRLMFPRLGYSSSSRRTSPTSRPSGVVTR